MTSLVDEVATNSITMGEGAVQEEAEEDTKAKTDTTTPAPKRTALEVIQQYGQTNVAGKRFVITGAYSGIGAATTKALLQGGAKVIMGGRDPKRLHDFTQHLKEQFGDNVHGYVLDLADLKSVQEFAKCVNGKFAHIEVLINNAGIMKCPPAVTQQGYELQMGTNVIGHFLLSKMLVEKTLRQVWVSSSGHASFGGPPIDIDKIKTFSLNNTSGYDGWSAYQQSKLGNILLAKEFHHRYRIETASCHPGVIQTNLGRHFNPLDYVKFVSTKIPKLISEEGWRPFKTPEQGASTTITAATLPSNQFQSGAYYRDCVVADECESAKNMDDAKALFDFCDEITKPFFVELRFI